MGVYCAEKFISLRRPRDQTRIVPVILKRELFAAEPDSGGNRPGGLSVHVRICLTHVSANGVEIGNVKLER